jgi:chromosome segregation ATPase
MQQILALRKTLAELNLRRQQAEARRREEDYRRCQRYMAQAVEVLATLTQRWRDLPADSVQAAEARKHLEQQSNLIANLLAEALELESGLTREEEPARQARDDANEEYEKYREQHHDAEVRLRKGKIFRKRIERAEASLAAGEQALPPGSGGGRSERRSQRDDGAAQPGEAAWRR